MWIHLGFFFKYHDVQRLWTHGWRSAKSSMEKFQHSKGLPAFEYNFISLVNSSPVKYYEGFQPWFLLQIWLWTWQDGFGREIKRTICMCVHISKHHIHHKAVFINSYKRFHSWFMKWHKKSKDRPLSFFKTSNWSTLWSCFSLHN